MRLDLTGQRFGRLVAVEPSDVVGPWRNLTWICKCDCGNTAIVKGEELTLAQACEKYGVPYGRTKARLLSGWADEDAIFIPKRGGAGWKTSLLQTRAK